VTAGRRLTLRRIAGGTARRVPLRPFRLLFPFRIWRPLVRFWPATIRAQPDRRKAMRELLEVYGDAYVGMDRGAVEYGEGVHPKHRLTRYHEFFVERLRPGERVLDVGCGIGSVAYDLAERSGATVVGIDVSPWALGVARVKFVHPRVSYVEADVVTYEPDVPFDVAVLSNVLEHVGPRVEMLRACASGSVRGDCSCACPVWSATGRCRCETSSGSRTSATRTMSSSTPRSCCALSFRKRAGR